MDDSGRVPVLDGAFSPDQHYRTMWDENKASYRSRIDSLLHTREEMGLGAFHNGQTPRGIIGNARGEERAQAYEDRR